VDAFGDRRLTGKVVQIVPAADPSSRSFLVKVELPATPDIRSGLFGRARFQRGQRDALLVPRTAVVNRGQLQGVYVLGPDKLATLRYITLGKPDADRMEVLSGLQGGEQVVANPGDRELGGKLIR
jgi:multidrug efflux pump subunit AcrA (membrane-fusion protein)